MFTPWRAHTIVGHVCVHCGMGVRHELKDGVAYSHEDAHGGLVWLICPPLGTVEHCTKMEG